MRALHTAATGMMAQELNVQVISNNIANMRTTGYKRQRAEFQDLLYEHVSRVGTQTSTQGNILPVGIDLGGGVKTVGTPRLMSQGTLLPTGNFDLAIRGEGFSRSRCRTAPSPTPATARSRWTRKAASSRRRATWCSPGSPFRRTRPAVTINPQGQVSIDGFRQTHATYSDRSRSPASSTRPACKASATTSIVETPASGALGRRPDGAGDFQQGNLEQANVEAVSEISDLIAAQRAYEMNAKVITAADQMLRSPKHAALRNFRHDPHAFRTARLNSPPCPRNRACFSQLSS